MKKENAKIGMKVIVKKNAADGCIGYVNDSGNVDMKVAVPNDVLKIVAIGPLADIGRDQFGYNVYEGFPDKKRRQHVFYFQDVEPYEECSCSFATLICTGCVCEVKR